MTTTVSSHATIPNFVVCIERRALVAGMTFLEVTATDTLDLRGLGEWFEEHVVATGVMPQLSVLLEPPVGSVALRPGTGALASANANLPRLVATARSRVVTALKGLIAAPSDDRFLRGSIFLGRVQRHEARWVARPEANAPLSGVVLSLFAAAFLADRSICDREMSVCDVCGRVSFDARPAMRSSCPQHAVRQQSGFAPRITSRGFAAGGR
jgi:hypothetical protein